MVIWSGGWLLGGWVLVCVWAACDGLLGIYFWVLLCTLVLGCLAWCSVWCLRCGFGWFMLWRLTVGAAGSLWGGGLVLFCDLPLSSFPVVLALGCRGAFVLWMLVDISGSL